MLEKDIQKSKKSKNPTILNQIRQFIDNDIIQALEKAKKVPSDRCRGKNGLSLTRFHDYLQKRDNYAKIDYFIDEKKILLF